MPSEVIPFSGFAFGEYGSQASYSVGFAVFRQHLLYRGWWTGQNIVRGIDGSLFPMPQPKLKSSSIVGLSSAVQNVGSGYASGRVGWLKSGNQIAQSSAGTYTFNWLTGTTANTTAFGDTIAVGSHTYACGASSAIHDIDHVAGTVAVLAGSPSAAQSICQYGDRLVVGGTAANKNRVYFSAAGDPTSWPAQNYFDVGSPNIPIVAVIPCRHLLFIATSASSEVSWWVLSGVPGYNDVLRRASLSPAPSLFYGAAPLVSNNVGFLSPSGTGCAPALFNGSAVSEYRYLSGLLTPSVAECYRMRQAADWFLFDGNTLLLQREGAWSKHANPGFRGGNGSFRSVIADPLEDTFAFWAPFGSGNFYEWNPYAQRPAFTSDLQGAIPDPATCYFSLPEWWTRSADEVAVSALVIDFVAWNTGDTSPNQFTVNATAMRTFDPNATVVNAAGDVPNSQPVTFSEATSKASTSGTRRRLVANFSRNFGSGFRVDFTNMRGVSIQKVVAMVDLRGAQGV